MGAARLLALLISFFPFFVPTFVPVAVAAEADSGVKIAQYQDWTVYRYGSKSGKVCYIGSLPAGGGGKSADPTSYAMVTAFVSGSAEFSVSIPNKAGGDIMVWVDEGKKMKLYTQSSMGWAQNSEMDAAMVAAMRRGNRLNVSVPSSTKQTSGKPSGDRVDKYSLAGFTAAYKHMQDSCK
jgi:hypothetical protein